MNNHFVRCCVRWAKAVSPRGKLWFWLLFLPLTGPLVMAGGGAAYEVVARLTIVGAATLIAVWISYLIRSNFDEDMELLLFRQMAEQSTHSMHDRASIMVSRALMVAASWLSRAIILIGFLWAVMIAFRGDYML